MGHMAAPNPPGLLFPQLTGSKCPLASRSHVLPAWWPLPLSSEGPGWSLPGGASARHPRRQEQEYGTGSPKQQLSPHGQGPVQSLSLLLHSPPTQQQPGSTLDTKAALPAEALAR